MNNRNPETYWAASSSPKIVFVQRTKCSLSSSTIIILISGWAVRIWGPFLFVFTKYRESSEKRSGKALTKIIFDEISHLFRWIEANFIDSLRCGLILRSETSQNTSNQRFSTSEHWIKKSISPPHWNTCLRVSTDEFWKIFRPGRVNARVIY